MIGAINIFQHDKLNQGVSTVWIADVSLSKIAEIGTIQLFEDLILSLVLHVPNLDCYLISTRKLTHDLNCVTKFYPNLYEFQAMDSGKVIGNVELCGGLYLLKENSSIQRSLLQVMFFNLFSILCQFQMKRKLCYDIFILVIQTLCILKSWFLICSTIEIPILIIVKSINLPSTLDMYIQAFCIHLHIHFLRSIVTFGNSLELIGFLLSLMVTLEPHGFFS